MVENVVRPKYMLVAYLFNVLFPFNTDYRNIHACTGTQPNIGLTGHINSKLNREDMDIYIMHRITNSIAAIRRIETYMYKLH